MHPIRPRSPRKDSPYPLDSALERIIRKALEELVEPVDVYAMFADAFDRILEAVDEAAEAAGLDPDAVVDDDFTITRRRLRELLGEVFAALDHGRLRTMVNTRDAVYMVARRLAPIIDDCVAKGFLAMPSVPRPRRQTSRAIRRNHRKSRQTSVQRGAA